MKNLTNDQILSVLSLTKQSPELFKAVSLMSLPYGYSIDIHSVENVPVHKCLNDIHCIFPDLEYRGAEVFNHDDGTYSVHHRYSQLTLYIDKAPGQEETPPTDMESEKEITHLNNTTEEEVRAIV